MKKLLCISLLILLLTGCGNKPKEKEQESLDKIAQEQEKAEENVYSVMSQIMTEYQLSKLDSEPIELPFTVTCNEKEGCTYCKGRKLDLEIVPKSGAFTLKDESLIFEPTSDIKMENYSCSISDKNIVTCKK